MRALRLGAHRAGYEIRGYFRSPDQVFFTFLFPVLFLALFTVIMGDIDASPLPVLSAVQYYLPAMIASGILLSGTQNLAVDIAMERSDGTLKRLGATPLPALSYFMGKAGQVAVTGLLQAALTIAVGAALGAELPSDPARWLTFAWVFPLGLLTCALLGVALSALPRSGKSATAVVIPIVLVLQFISGVYVPFLALPDWLQTVASAFPLKWMAQGMREAFLPAEYGVMEQGEVWNLPGVAVALLVWLVVGGVLARLTFRWTRRDA